MKKILFNDKYGLTQAVLEGRKTQTRRLLTLTLHKKADRGNALIEVSPSKVFFENGKWKFVYDDYVFLLPKENYPKYRVGEMVAVAQSYRDCGGINKDGRPNWDVIAEAKGASNVGWDNKMFVRADLMPHQIRITDVRVERLQDISDEDCIKEGVVKDTCKTYFNGYTVKFSLDQYNNILSSEWFRTPREAFAHLINKVSRKDVWEENPYVFVYDFEVIK